MTVEEQLAALNEKVLDLEKTLANSKGRGNNEALERRIEDLKTKVDELLAKSTQAPPPAARREGEEVDELAALLGD